MQKIRIFAAVLAGGYCVLLELGAGTTGLRPASKGSIISSVTGPSQGVTGSTLIAIN